MTRRLLLLSAAFVAVACSNAGENLGLPSLPTGTIATRVYFDRDGSQTFTTGDTTVAGIRVAIFAAGGRDTLAVASTDTAGIVIFDTLPVGSYRVALDPHSLGDSIGLVAGDTGFTRIVADSGGVARLIRIGFPEVTLQQLRTMPAGRRVFVRGTVESPLEAFHDSSTFLSDRTGYLRITHSRSRVTRGGNNIGDSVLVLGTTDSSLGQPVLGAGLIGTLGLANLPIPVPVTVAQASDAEGGTLDAALVTLDSAVIVDTMAVGPDFQVTVADPNNAAATAGILIDSTLHVAHSVWVHALPISIKGVLMPTGNGTWVVKPRFQGDITLGNFPEVTISQLRALPAGKHVYVRGVIESPFEAFHDSSTFISDATGHLRITHSHTQVVRGINNVGDSVLVLGITGSLANEPVLDSGVVGTLGLANFPVPVDVSVPEAISANGGTLDAALVKLSGGVIIDTMSASPDFELRVADTANPAITVGVVIDTLLRISPAVWAPNLHITLVGVLVPVGDGTWVIKPRLPADILLSN